MAPTLYNRFSGMISGKEGVKAPFLSSLSAAALSIAFTALYVLPFYLSPTTRPSLILSRDAPSVIRARIRFVIISTFISTVITSYILSTCADESLPSTMHALGIYPIHPITVGKSVLLTALLFAGPLFEKAIIESGWRRWIKGKDIHETLSSWIGWRNFVAGPITEEVLFRSVIISLHTHTRPLLPVTTLIFLTPLYFGIAHIHHFYEFTLTHPYTPLLPALVRSLIQLAYTTVFGWYASFVFVRTGSLWAVVLIHSLCNWMGLPRIWGRVGGVEVQGGVVGGPTRGKEDVNAARYHGRQRLGIVWTMAYYFVLITGAIAWWETVWPLTESQNALAELRFRKGG
ncbi:MAG: hypothetical protein Q9163_000633 [Psora crenata]